MVWWKIGRLDGRPQFIALPLTLSSSSECVYHPPTSYGVFKKRFDMQIIFVLRIG